MAVTQTIDPVRQEHFVGKVLGDTSAWFVTMMAALGDRLALFKDLAANGPADSRELALRAGVNERYAREWLGCMAAAGYLDYDTDTGRFTLPLEHTAALANEAGPFFFGGVHQMIADLPVILDRLTDAFRKGGGVPQSAYPESFWEGMSRFTAGWFENLLLQQWIPAMPDVERKLRDGATVADVGCGRGRALIKMASAFHNSRFVGFDVFGPALAVAADQASAAGVDDRVRFELRDVVKGLPDRYDIITTFDVVHDAVEPLGLLGAIRRALRPDGIYICLDINCSHRLEENVGPLGAMFHGISVMYCMTTSLANNGAGLGTLGFHERKAHELCRQAGFSSVRRLPLENPFNSVYEVRP
jgi:SAM-dependent methyltransferase